MRDVGQRRKYQTIYACLGLWIIQSLRSPLCGGDLLSNNKIMGYLPVFMNIDNYSYKELLSWTSNNMEPGWLIYTKVIYLFSQNPQIYLVVTSAVPIILVGYTIYKQSRDIILSFYVFACFGLYHFSFSGIRQALAFSITFFAYNFLFKKRGWLIFSLLVLLASTFHSSAIIFIFTILIKNVKIDIGKGVLCLIGIFLLIPFLKEFVLYVSLIIFSGERYQHIGSEGVALTMFVVYVVIFLVSFLIKISQINREHIYFLRWMALFSVFAQSLGFISTGSITRVGYYFTIFYLLLFAELLKANIDPRFVKFFRSVSVVLLVSFFYLVNKDGYLDVIPYHFFWEDNIML